MQKTIVISAVNLVEGGTLTVLRDCIQSAEAFLGDDWRIVALLNKPDLVESTRVEKICFPAAKKSWFTRIYYEWIYFNRLSRKIKPYLWLSLHDITPRVQSVRQAVYCHNPAPFYRASWRESRLDFGFFLFNKFYKYLYGALISRNFMVIVQQEWLRDEFHSMYGELPILVAHPNMVSTGCSPLINSVRDYSSKTVFLYPSFPRVHKNFETLCEAAEQLNRWGIRDFRVEVTLAGNENRYARDLYQHYRTVKNLEFIGLQSREEMADRYRKSDVVVFPGKLETWGLPISEAKSYGKVLLLADRPYARETVGTYDRVSFFEATNSLRLANLMRSIIESNWQPQGNVARRPADPFVSNWIDLWSMLVASNSNVRLKRV
jgi:glycosyltransferase involved in cell wall biosynthesis